MSPEGPPWGWHVPGWRVSDGTEASWDAFGAYLRSQRQLAQLSLRQLSALTRISNPYLSQIERGLHQPSIGILKSLAEALNLSVSELLGHAAGVVAGEEPATTTEVAIRTDPRLNDAQKSALLAVYASMADATAPMARGRRAACGERSEKMRPPNSTSPEAVEDPGR